MNTLPSFSKFRTYKITFRVEGCSMSQDVIVKSNSDVFAINNAYSDIARAYGSEMKYTIENIKIVA